MDTKIHIVILKTNAIYKVNDQNEKLGKYRRINMNILLFNNRDLMNPSSGGAEVFTHEISKRWVEAGNSVTVISSGFPSCKKIEYLDGVKIVRMGSALSVYPLAERYYKKFLKGNCDVIIDEYTLRPFITPKFAKEPIIFLCHELAREKYFYELPLLLSNIFFYKLEPGWMKNYTNLPTVTVSDSTKKDLIEHGFNQIYIVPEGIDFSPLSRVSEKETDFTMIFVGLLKKANLVEHSIEAFRIVSKVLPKSKLWIVGRGPLLSRLKKQAHGLNVTFFGYVSNEKKLELMKRSHLLVVPAIREGWGLVVTEANACGTPAVGYDVPGLRDSIKHGFTGLLTRNDPISLAEAAIKFHDKNYSNALANNALEFSRMFSWNNTAKKFMDVINEVV